MTNQLSIKTIIDTPTLKTKIISGATNINNPVKWAHVCELKDPTFWLSTNDLLMTTGIGIPTNANEQRAYIQKLSKAQLSGIMIGENMEAPEDISALCDEAEKLNFPILITQYGVPFAAVTKLIVDANNLIHIQKNNLITILYEYARTELHHRNLLRFIKGLEELLDISIYLIDQQTHENWHVDLPIIPSEFNDNLQALLHNNRNIPSLVNKIELKDQKILYNLLLNTHNCELIIISSYLDYSLLHHIGALVSLMLEKNSSRYYRELRNINDLIEDIIHQRISDFTINKQLKEHGMNFNEMRALHLSLKNHIDYEQILFRKNITALFQIHREKGYAIALVNNDDIPEILPLFSAIGISNILNTPNKIITGLQEAKLAFEKTDSQKLILYYADLTDSYSLLPNNIEALQNLFEITLGALKEQDETKGTKYLQTLTIFLKNNKAWETSAKRLHIHRQTLIYRIQKIEELLNRDINSTQDCAEIWFALKAANILKIITLE